MATIKNDKYRIELIADEIEKIRQVDDKGNISFKGFLINELLLVLETSLSLSSQIPDEDLQNILWKAVTNAGKNGPITKQKLLASIRRQESYYLKKDLQSFVLLTSVSIDPLYVQPFRRAMKGCYFTFEKTPADRSDNQERAWWPFGTGPFFRVSCRRPIAD